jgi:Tfp pilus assembly protein PilF
MSLLLDALKRAEQEKQARQSPAPGKPALELAPIASAQPQAAGRAGAPAAGAPSAPSPATSAKATREGGPRKALWVAAAAIVLLIVAGGAYVWYSIAALSPPAIARAPAPRPIAAPPPASPILPAPTPTSSAPTAKVDPPVALVDAPKPRPAPQARSAPPDAATASAPAGMLQPARPADRARIAPEVASGYAALRRGDLAVAKRDYAAALAADGANLDATLGLATAEARGGRMDAAVTLYRRALEIDPRNATALAGLAALSDLTRPDMLEQQLSREIAQHPSSASLHFMLGNVYASQSLWTQAQAAYYEAHRLDPGNPDILHNLAVSLDRLGQPRLAATMYRRALEAARSQATQLDVAAVQKRLDEIETR